MSGDQCNHHISILKCTLQTCCWDQAFVHYPPILAGNATYLAIFAVFLIAQFGLGVWFRTWGFWVGMSCGLILEVIGYAGRLMLRTDPYNLNTFLLYFIPMGLGPAFMTAAIYLTLGRIVVIYSEQYSRFKPRLYTIFFVSFDIFSLVIQAIGGALTASSTDNQTLQQQGTDILITGLTLQAFSLLTFEALCLDFALRIRNVDSSLLNPECEPLRRLPRFRLFLWSISIAAISILIRCIYRVVELAQGFSGSIANNEPAFMALEGPFIMVACLFLTISHPGIVLRGFWEKSNWRLRKNKTQPSHIAEKEQKLETPSDSEGETPL